jgi:hypothetical protein
MMRHEGERGVGRGAAGGQGIASAALRGARDSRHSGLTCNCVLEPHGIIDRSSRSRDAVQSLPGRAVPTRSPTRGRCAKPGGGRRGATALRGDPDVRDGTLGVMMAADFRAECVQASIGLARFIANRPCRCRRHRRVGDLTTRTTSPRHRPGCALTPVLVTRRSRPGRYPMRLSTRVLVSRRRTAARSMAAERSRRRNRTPSRRYPSSASTATAVTRT